MVKTTQTTVDTVDTSYNYFSNCAYKLPCGICRLTMLQCPKTFNYIYSNSGTNINSATSVGNFDGSDVEVSNHVK